MHLPFSSILPSFAATDARAAYSVRAYEGSILEPQPVIRTNSESTPFKRRATAIHDVDHSLPTNGPHRPRHASSATRLLKTSSGLEDAAPPDAWVSPALQSRDASRWGTNAFTGSKGHLHDGLRFNLVRPALAEFGSTGSLHGSHAEARAGGYVTQHPMARLSPGPGSYNQSELLTHTFAQCKRFDRTVPNDVHHQRSATIVRPGATPHQATYTRCVDITNPGQANIHDATPGPGAYPLSEWSPFDPRPRTVPGVPFPASRSSSVGFGKEHFSVRGATSSFSTGARSDVSVNHTHNIRDSELETASESQFMRAGRTWLAPKSRHQTPCDAV